MGNTEPQKRKPPFPASFEPGGFSQVPQDYLKERIGKSQIGKLQSIDFESGIGRII